VPEAIRVIRYDPEWPRRFEAERALLEGALAPWLDGGVHHVGSTAIPGISAKPIIDMIAGVRDLDEARAASEPLNELGYRDAPHRPGIAHHFAKIAPEGAEFGLHLTERESDLWRERLTFRDLVQGDPELAAEYEALKLRLAAAHPGDSRAYTAGKRAFVGRVLASAGVEFGRR
jgi:GrpB-like predicted nucleotidyltransferase (UPF0157 family)